MFRFPRIMISRRWKWPKVLIALFALELAGTVAALTLFGIAQPDLFRTRLWQLGADNGWNSSPKARLYAYANYRPVPSVPFIWSKTITDFNVAISVLCTFILLVKGVMFVVHLWYPLLSTITNAIIVALWCVSIYGQTGPDNSDPRHPSSVAWYITKSCDVAKASGNHHNCVLAKSTFATTIIMMFIFFLNLLLGIWSMIPSAMERAANDVEVDDMQMTKGSPVSDNASKPEWEMKNVPRQPAVPYTPRTLAFNTLDRQLPLRSQEGPRWA
ncbi:uncharacterized protein RCO7_05738 [Rhynchosporium graminicola]|uniref:Uncharacterized protein n=1 Tax=Rhynchosporium graminicola TaxID=2792576 RepID=A0A1E1KF80_9HELO|nr:uncharacterized protein RCO7_05738 [Rhynchosporium commune]